MSLTSGKQITAAAGAAVTLLAGPALIATGVLTSRPASALAGVAMAMVGLTLTILLVVRGWVTNTSADRARLAQDQREAREEKARYFAAQAALENEQARLHRDLRGERAALARRIKAEREALAAEFEERRAELISETMEATVRMFHDGKFAPSSETGGTLIEFPKQHDQAEPEPSGVRERGVAGPQSRAPRGTRA
ncbi:MULTISPECIES: hypothetical protein [unclassified Streptomyces]|uniref:hypothetical protein n=1 Tax=unclassified Streptomyces TaxID=2593676 RepID=UPI003BB65B4F